MEGFPALLRAFLSSSDASGTRSTILTDLRWVLSILVVGILGSGWASLPGWVLILLGTGVALDLVVMLGAFIIFSRRNPDLLRTESYTLRKMEIERGFLGDSESGLLEASPEVIALPSSLDRAPSGDDG